MFSNIPEEKKAFYKEYESEIEDLKKKAEDQK